MSGVAIKLSDHFTYGRLVRFALPSIAMMIFISIYSVVDGLFVSNFAGKEALAAVNLVFPLVMALGSVGFMFGTGGAALVGETSLQTVRRELREETGIEADEADFHLVRSFREHSTFSDVYFLFHDIPLSALHLQPGETTEARWVSKAGLEALVASGEVAQPDVRRLRQLRDEFRKIWNA